jgi:hypothetical protein
MSEKWEIIAAGKLQSAIKPLFAVDPKESATIYQITLVSDDSGQRQVSVYIQKRLPDGSFSENILFSPKGLLIDEGDRHDILDNPIQLGGNDSFNGICDVADQVHFIVFGITKKP